MIGIVLATHNRPASLRVAIRSVVQQTLPDWRLLVVGDDCDGRTAAVVAEFADPRIAYVNLAQRCGEQAIPNSVGMAATKGEYIALLNHDDVWLEDHLALALARLEESGGDLYSGCAAYARFSVRDGDQRGIPVFSELTPAQRQLGDVFSAGCEAFEPCSAWVFRRRLFETVGGWRAAAVLYRPPMEDWLLRAWRAEARLVAGDEISVLRILTHYQQSEGAAAYQWDLGEYDYLEQLLAARSPAWIRSGIEQNLRSGVLDRVPKLGFSRILLDILGQLDPEQQWLARQFLTPAMAEVYRRTGWDAFEQFCLLAGFGRGHAIQVALGRRTGERLPPVPDAERLLAQVRKSLAAAPSW